MFYNQMQTEIGDSFPFCHTHIGLFHLQEIRFGLQHSNCNRQPQKNCFILLISAPNLPEIIHPRPNLNLVSGKINDTMQEPAFYSTPSDPFKIKYATTCLFSSFFMLLLIYILLFLTALKIVIFKNKTISVFFVLCLLYLSKNCNTVCYVYELLLSCAITQIFILAFRLILFIMKTMNFKNIPQVQKKSRCVFNYYIS